MTQTSYSLEEVRMLLGSDPRWTEKAIVRLFEFQTSEEQDVEETTDHNGVGFNSSDARRLTYYAKWINSGKHLSDKYLLDAQRRVPKYARQILSLINNKK